MALVRKTNALEVEIHDEIDKIIRKDIESIHKRGNVQTLVNNVANTLFEEGLLVDNQVTEHIKAINKLDIRHEFDITSKAAVTNVMYTAYSSCAPISSSAVSTKNFGNEDMALLNEIHLPRSKVSNAMHSSLLHKNVLFCLFTSYSAYKFGLMFRMNSDVDDTKEYEFRTSNFHYGIKGFGPVKRVAQDIGDLSIVKNMDKLNDVATKAEQAVQRMQKVRNYIFDDLWPACASLNTMHKHFPGILEYVSAETIERFNKNSPKRASINTDLIPSGDILAATAKAKLK